MVNRKSGESSLYIQLLNQLKDELKKKRIGEKIESELELMAKYNVSRGTVRHAIDVLVESGDVYKIHGKGTFKGNGIPDIDVHTFIPSFTTEMVSTGRIPTISDIRVEEVGINSEGASYLNVEVGTPVWKLSRFRGEYGVKPYCYACAYILKSVCPHLKPSDLQMSLVSMLMDKFHLPVSKTINIISIKNLDKDLSLITGEPEGLSVLKNTFVLSDVNKIPVVYDVSYNWKTDFEYVVRSEIIN